MGFRRLCPGRRAPCLGVIILLISMTSGQMHQVQVMQGAPPAPTSGPQILTGSVTLRLYGPNGYAKEYFLDTEADHLLNDVNYRRDRPLVLYTHGYMESPESESVKTVIGSLMQLDKYNLVAVNWSKIAKNFYLIPVMMSFEVGASMARVLDRWHLNRQVLLPHVYLIGHSLGGQVSGLCGKKTQTGKVARITALDPAFPGYFFRQTPSLHLAATDAQFVDVIHTDSGHYGVPYSTGHADFYPNGGRRLQPGCPANTTFLSDEDFCSHWRSWRFFAESVTQDSNPFYGVACQSENGFNNGRCLSNAVVPMGYHTPPNTRGTFFLRTSDAAPFSLGRAGTTPR